MVAGVRDALACGSSHRRRKARARKAAVHSPRPRARFFLSSSLVHGEGPRCFSLTRVVAFLE